MKEIRFKGKDINTSEWMYGNLIWNNGSPYIVGDFVEVDKEHCTLEFWHPVDAHTVREYTKNKEKKDKTDEMYDLYKIPDDVLIKNLRCEMGKMESYISELEYNIKEKDRLIDILKNGDKTEIRKIRQDEVFQEYKDKIKLLEKKISQLRKDNMELIIKLHKKNIAKYSIG